METAKTSSSHTNKNRFNPTDPNQEERTEELKMDFRKNEGQSRIVPLPPYTPAVVADGSRSLLFLSGQLPIDPESGEISPTDVGGQTLLALSNALKLVKSHGATTKDVVKVVVFTTQLGLLEEINANYLEALGDVRPARTMVEVSALPRQALVEIELIASIPS